MSARVFALFEGVVTLILILAAAGTVTMTACTGGVKNEMAQAILPNHCHAWATRVVYVYFIY